MAHGNRGRIPANRISEPVRQEILRLAKETYQDYNDCHFTEELAEQPEPIVVSRSTLRRIRRPLGKAAPGSGAHPSIAAAGSVIPRRDALANRWQPP